MSSAHATGLVERHLTAAAGSLRRAIEDLSWVKSANVDGHLRVRHLIVDARHAVSRAQHALAQLPGIASTRDTFSHGGGI